MYGLGLDLAHAVELDSSTPAKVSRHLVLPCMGHAFHDNSHVGAFVSSLLQPAPRPGVVPTHSPEQHARGLGGPSVGQPSPGPPGHGDSVRVAHRPQATAGPAQGRSRPGPALHSSAQTPCPRAAAGSLPSPQPCQQCGADKGPQPSLQEIADAQALESAVLRSCQLGQPAQAPPGQPAGHSPGGISHSACPGSPSRDAQPGRSAEGAPACACPPAGAGRPAGAAGAQVAAAGQALALALQGGSAADAGKAGTGASPADARPAQDLYHLLQVRKASPLLPAQAAAACRSWEVPPLQGTVQSHAAQSLHQLRPAGCASTKPGL